MFIKTLKTFCRTNFLLFCVKVKGTNISQIPEIGILCLYWHAAQKSKDRRMTTRFRIKARVAWARFAPITRTKALTAHPFHFRVACTGTGKHSMPISGIWLKLVPLTLRAACRDRSAATYKLSVLIFFKHPPAVRCPSCRPSGVRIREMCLNTLCLVISCPFAFSVLKIRGVKLALR
jgi:hypothetical protein